MTTQTNSRLTTALILSALFLQCPAQSPQLNIKEKNATVSLEGLKVDINVTGNIAITTMEMTFYNKMNRILEGELVFPLPEGSSVSRYAIDINGKMREAVPVEKQKGTQVFEAIEHRRVDPGLLEKTEGNNFRTRIYPIPANGRRTVLIAYEQELLFNKDNSLRYHLPMDYKKSIDNFKLEITVLQSSFKPSFEETPDGDLSFNEWNNNYTATMEKSNFTPGHSLSFDIPKGNDATEVMMQKVGANYYYLVNTFLKKETRSKQIPGKIAVVWDASLSGLSRDTKKELELLGKYIEKKKNLVISLYVLNNECRKTGEFNIQNNNWSELKKTIENLTYDGGTNYSKIRPAEMTGDEILFFSDGLSTLSDALTFAFPKPVYTINSSPKADYSTLQSMAQKSGASFINLNELNNNESIKLLTEQPLTFLCIKSNPALSENYPSVPKPVISNSSIAGISTEENTAITLQYGYGKEVAFEKTVSLNYNKHKASTVNIQKIWAQKKIAELEMDYESNKEIISQLGKRFSIVTRNTSLIVLENVTDYVQYDIEPPAELREAFDRIIKERLATRQTQQVLVMNNAFRYAEELMEWWNKDNKPPYVKNPVQQVQPIQNQQTEQPVTGNRPVNRSNQNRTTLRHDRSIAVGTIKGQVLDQNGIPFVGATVSLRGTHTAVATAADGSFQLRYQGNTPILVFTAVGMDTKEIAVQNNNYIKVSLGANSNQLSEVVVTALGIRTQDGVDDELEARKDLTGAVATLKADQALEGKVAGLSVSGSPGANSNARVRGYATEKDKEEEEVAPVNNFVNIDIKQWTPERTYLKTIARAKKDQQYLSYIQLRKDYLNTPSFYFDMACYFFQQKDSANGLLILSNMAELDLDNHELYKLLGFKLKETGNYEEETYVFRKVLLWRPQEPQSYRDYGLALADAGLYQQALDTLYTAISRQYDGNVMSNYNGIEETIATEINQLVSMHGDKLDISHIDKKLLHPMPVDVRVVINWNMNDTDIDLWVTDPNDEKCYYSHKITEIGGRISNDFTQGYGPEQFLLKKALKGKYKIEVDFYGERQVKLTGPTTVMAEVYTHYGDGRQERKIITIQLEKNERQNMLVGEFNFNQ